MHFRRSGGLLGKPIEADVAEDDLDPAGAEALARVLDRSGSEPAPAPPGGGTAADAYQYDLTIRRGDEEISLSFDETRMPEELYPLVEACEQRALRRPD